MTLTADWAPSKLNAGQPRYMAILEAVDYDVRTGALLPGARLPTQRDLAKRLGVTVRTVGRAYALAAERGLVSGEVGRGTFIRSGTSVERNSISDGVVDLSQNIPASGPFGKAFVDVLRALAAEKDLGWLAEYAPHSGHLAHRQRAVSWLKGVGLEASPDRIVTTAGAQQALFIALAGLRDSGPIMVERMTYPIALDAIRALGLRAVAVDIDEFGMRPDALEKVARDTGARTALIVPTLHNPTTAVMPEERRQEIAEIARRNDLYLIEDDVYGFLLQERPLPIATIAPERTTYLASASKCLGPGLRVGWLVAPPSLVERFAATAAAMTLAQPQLMFEIAHRWIKNGTASDLLGWQRSELSARYDVADEALPGLDWSGQRGGLHIFLKLPPVWKSEMFTAAAEARCGVRTVPSSAFLAPGETENGPAGVRISISAASDRGVLAERLTALGKLARSAPAVRSLII